MSAARLIPHDTLRDFVTGLFHAAGLSHPKAALAADCLVFAALRGVDSHGIQLAAYYLEQMEAGDLDMAADGEVVSESGACLLYDGRNGLGQWVSEVCCGHALRLAGEHGIGLAVARESNHFGAAAYWAGKLSAAGCLGLVFCNASPIVPPWQGKEGRLGTNPICMSVPGSRTWLLDMATTTVAGNRIFKAFLNGDPEIPAGWALDRDGVPTTDPRTAHDGLLMPLGGYKGSGLAFMVEILCGVLSGGGMSTDLGGIRWRGTRTRASQAFLAIDVKRFMPVEQFDARMKWLVENMKSSAPASGYDEVLVAGEPEWRIEEQRLRHGVPVPEGNWNRLVGHAARLGVAVPETAGLQ